MEMGCPLLGQRPVSATHKASRAHLFGVRQWFGAALHRHTHTHTHTHTGHTHTQTHTGDTHNAQKQPIMSINAEGVKGAAAGQWTFVRLRCEVEGFLSSPATLTTPTPDKYVLIGRPTANRGQGIQWCLSCSSFFVTTWCKCFWSSESPNNEMNYSLIQRRLG